MTGSIEIEGMMPEAREDLQVETGTDLNLEDRFEAALNAEDEQPAPAVEPEAQPVSAPAVEGEQAPDDDVRTTHTPEEEKAEQDRYAEEKLRDERGDLEVEDGQQEVELVDDPLYAIRIDGQEEEVPLSELLQGYSRTADYTRKTQSLSEDKKTFEDERQANRVERERNARLFEQGESWLQSMKPAEPDWDSLRQSDPAEYAAQLAEHQQRNEQLRLIQQEREAIQQKQHQDNQNLLQQHLQTERTKLVEALPEWKDTETARTEQQGLMDAGLAAGYTPEELGQVYDHRAVIVLRKAMLYDRIQAGKPQVVRQARRAPVLKPGAANVGPRKPAPSRLTRAREELRKTGSTKAAESYFFEALQAEDK